MPVFIIQTLYKGGKMGYIKHNAFEPNDIFADNVEEAFVYFDKFKADQRVRFIKETIDYRKHGISDIVVSEGKLTL